MGADQHSPEGHTSLKADSSELGYLCGVKDPDMTAIEAAPAPQQSLLARLLSAYVPISDGVVRFELHPLHPNGALLSLGEVDFGKQQPDRASVKQSWSDDNLRDSSLLARVVEINSDHHHADRSRAWVDDMQILEADTLVASDKRGDVGGRAREGIVR